MNTNERLAFAETIRTLSDADLVAAWFAAEGDKRDVIKNRLETIELWNYSDRAPYAV